MPTPPPCGWARHERSTGPRRSCPGVPSRRPALVDGLVGVTWAPGERDGVVWDITTVGQTIVGIDMVADTDSLDELDLVILG